MNDYIEREAVNALIKAECSPKVAAYLIDAVATIPAADVRPVIFCRDCKHSTPWYSNKLRCFLWHEDGIDVFNDDFCNYGEKREES